MKPLKSREKLMLLIIIVLAVWWLLALVSIHRYESLVVKANNTTGYCIDVLARVIEQKVCT